MSSLRALIRPSCPLCCPSVKGLNEVRGQRGVKILGHLEPPSIETERASGGFLLYAHQAGNRHTGSGNGDLFADSHTPQEPREMSLSLMSVHFHGGFIVD